MKFFVREVYQSTFHFCTFYMKVFTHETKLNKTGDINDPLGQRTVPAGNDCRLILKFWD